MKTAIKGQMGFTLVELVVVIAILGVLAAITVPMVNNFLGSSKAQAYNLERTRIQDAVIQFRLSPTSVRFVGKRQYPIHGLLKTRGEFAQPDENDTADTVLITGNVLGGTEGGIPEWVDNQNGIRDEPDEEVLNDEDDTTQPCWQVATLTRQGTDYVVDSRDFFINFEMLVSEGYLEAVPASASPDNVPPGSNRTLIGPYSWFVNEKGIVESLLFSFPTSGNTGFQDVFPSQKQPKAVETSTISGAASVSEGTEYTLNLQSSETRPTPTSWEITWGDGEVEELDGNPSSDTHTFADGDGVFPIVAKTTDEEGTLTSNLLTLTVTNVAPTIALSGGSSVNTGLPFSLSFG